MSTANAIVPALAIAFAASLIVPIRAGRHLLLRLPRKPFRADFARVDSPDLEPSRGRERDTKSKRASPVRSALPSSSRLWQWPWPWRKRISTARIPLVDVAAADFGSALEAARDDRNVRDARDAELSRTTNADDTNGENANAAWAPGHSDDANDRTSAHERVGDGGSGIIAQAEPTGECPRASVRTGRVVPLTRLPLRYRPSSVEWPTHAAPPRTALSREARHLLLMEVASAPSPASEDLLVAAYYEEDALGRVLALRGLKHRRSDRTRSVFEEALRTGSDDERALAIDALAASGADEILISALGDRVDALAARAALAIVRSKSRADYCVRLAPFADAARIETLLALLAGYVE